MFSTTSNYVQNERQPLDLCELLTELWSGSHEVSCLFHKFIIIVVIIGGFMEESKTEAMAPNFFSSTPKSIPPIGKRESFRSLRLKPERSEMTQQALKTLNEVLPYIDANEDGLITVEELVRIPVIWKVLKANWKELLVPQETMQLRNFLRYF